jgi:hypothetical protein
MYEYCTKIFKQVLRKHKKTLRAVAAKYWDHLTNKQQHRMMMV